MQHASLRSFNQATSREGRFALLLLDGFSHLDLACTLEPLRLANEVMGSAAFHWRTLSPSGTAVRSSLCFDAPVAGPLTTLAREETLVLLAGATLDKADTSLTLPALRREHAHGRRLIGIFGGVLLLAQAGLLDEEDCALHWHLTPALSAQNRDIHARPIAYHQGRITTAAGGTATADLMLAEITRLLGPDIAARVADLMAYHAARSPGAAQTASIFTAASNRNPKLAQIIRMMERNLTTPTTSADLAEAASVSVRQMERLFATSLQTSPSSFYLSLRLTRARNLLHQTDLPVDEVAAATGFASSAHFSKRFRREFGTSPYGTTRSGTVRTAKDAS